MTPANAATNTVPVVPAGDAITVPVTPESSAAAPVTPAVPTSPTIPKNRTLVINGRGFGHGRGLGQWGAYGYAKDYGWNYRQILDHYYGGTAPGQVSPRSAIGVRLTAMDNKVLTVFQPKGRLYTAPQGQAGYTLPPGLAAAQPGAFDLNAPLPAPGNPIPVVPAGGAVTPPTDSSTRPSSDGSTAVAANPTAPPILTGAAAAIKIELIKGGFRISDAATCAGPWSVRPGVLAVTSITLSAGPTDPSASPDSPEEMLQMCVGKQRKVYRGDLLAIDAKPTQSGQRTVNVVGLEAYIRSVVPREISASWGDKAPESVKAQAVAARSYASAEKRTGFSNTCDTISCQVYSGRGVYDGAKFTSLEDARTDRAIAETASEVRVNPKTGAPIRTEFSASTGGWTAGGDFPAVEDRGDATSANPNNNWTVRIGAPRLEGKANGLGAGLLVGAKVTKRDGNGSGGGRATQVELRYTTGTKTMTGKDLQSKFGLKSNMFEVSVASDGSGAGPGAETAPVNPAEALTGDAGGAIPVVSQSDNSPKADQTSASLPAISTGTPKKPKSTKKRKTKTTIAVVVAASGTPVVTVDGGDAAGAPTTVKSTKPPKSTKKKRKRT